MDSASRTKILRATTPEKTAELARFTLRDGVVTANYTAPSMQSSMESSGIFSGGVTLRPRDGVAFFDALDRAYASSSFLTVREVSGDRRIDVGPPSGVHVAGGQGYNPYRANDGKFAPGAHKAKPKGPPRVKAAATAKAAGAPKAAKAAAKPNGPKRTKFDDSKHREVIAAHKATEAHHRGESLKIVAQQRALREQAKALPKGDKAGRAELRAQHQALGAKRAEHQTAAREARTARIAESKAMQAGRAAHVASQKAASTQHAQPGSQHQKAEGNDKAKATPAQHQAPPTQPAAPASKPQTAPPPRAKGDITAEEAHRIASTDHRLSLFNDSSAGHADPQGNLTDRQWTPEAQRAIRDHHNTLFAAYALHDKDRGLPESHVLEVRTEQGMGGDNLGLHWHNTGRMAVPISQAQNLARYSDVDSAGFKKLGTDYMAGHQNAHDAVDAYITSTHEALHGHGPQLSYGTHPSQRAQYTMIDEFTTELAAQRIAADVHGLHVHDIDGSYQNYLHPTIAKAAELSGRDRREATQALSEAALWHKRRSDRNLDPEEAIYDVAAHAMKRLGVTNEDLHTELGDHMIGTAEDS